MPPSVARSLALCKDLVLSVEARTEPPRLLYRGPASNGSACRFAIPGGVPTGVTLHVRILSAPMRVYLEPSRFRIPPSPSNAPAEVKLFLYA